MNTKTRRLGIATAAVAAALAVAAGQPAGAQTTDTPVDEPDSFTSMFTSNATPDAVINPDGVSAPGEPGATGTFNFRINSTEEIICWDITLNGVTPPFQSMARTATHVHQAAAGMAGPPRLAFPNPTDAGNGTLNSNGCMQGPFTTGIEGADGNDTGTGFTLAQIEADPAAFAADTHTSTYVPGVVRGQLAAVPMGGVDTGGGGMADAADGGGGTTVLLTSAGLIALAGGGLALRKRQAVVTHR